MRLTATTYSHLWSTTLGGALAELADLGFVTAEVMASPPHVSLGADGDSWVAETIRATDGGGPRVVSVNPPGLDLNLASPDARVRQESVRQYERAIDGASAVGAGFVVVVPGRRSPLLPCPGTLAADWVREGLRDLADRAAAADVRLLLENTPSGFMDAGQELSELIDSSGCQERVGICYDVANGFMVEDPSTTLSSLGSRVEMVHISDTERHRWAHSGIGAGHVDWRSLAWLATSSDSRTVVLETIHPDNPVDGVRADLQALRSFGWEV